MSRILVVEDNPEYCSGACEFFKKQPDVVLDIANDHCLATIMLEEHLYDSALVDCFFPKLTGSGDISLGKKAVEKMADFDPNERKIKKRLEMLCCTNIK